MALFVETSEEDSWMAVVAYIGELIDGEQVGRPRNSLQCK